MLIRSSRRVLAIVKQNMALTVGLKLLFLVLSIAGWSTIWLALLADDGASFLAIMNGLRALKRH
jgi:Cd2+/Zn2+-exporting ATPase